MTRKRFNFWLDDKRSEDWQINELIVTLKRAGQFTRAIREGLRLWVDLRAGNTAVLYELFPFISEKFSTPAVAPVIGAGGSELAKEIAAQIVLMGGTPGYMMQAVEPAGQGPKPLKAPSFAMPIHEDDNEPTVIIRASTNSDSSMNLVTALRNMQ
jgi:hypothetical protein